MTDKPYIKPSDARSWLHCKRRVWYDNFPPKDFEIGDPDPFDALIMKMGINHEWGIKRDLEKQFKIVEAVSNEHTLGLMKAGAEVIYQGELIDEEAGIIGKPDFLIKQPNGEYQAADAKLARTDDKKEIQIQLGVYRKLLGNMLPALVFLGDKSTVDIADEATAVTDKFLADMPTLLESKETPEARYGESKCKVCPYNGLCKPGFQAKEELTLLYGIDARNAPHLEAQGIPDITALSKVNPKNIDDVPYLKGFEKKQRAVLQAQAYFSDKDYQIAPVSLPDGTWVHFDIEVNPLTDSGEEHVYLWGFLKPPYKGNDFEYVWTDHEDDDKQGWLQFLELMEKYKADYPDLVLCHFSPYEVVNIKRYAKRYEMENHPIVEWLLGDDTPLFDIKPAVTDSFVLPLAGYGLKNICKHEGLVNFQWSDGDSGSQWSVVQFVKYRSELIKTRRGQMKSDILTYNFDDVVATRKLEEWLRKI
jgi:predicted RecB family nuclease